LFGPLGGVATQAFPSRHSRRFGVQQGSMLVPRRAFPGPQGRLVLAMLAAEHGVPVSRDQLAEEVWNGSPPPEWEVWPTPPPGTGPARC
jgi:hypothetical protein